MNVTYHRHQDFFRVVGDATGSCMTPDTVEVSIPPHRVAALKAAQAMMDSCNEINITNYGIEGGINSMTIPFMGKVEATLAGEDYFYPASIHHIIKSATEIQLGFDHPRLIVHNKYDDSYLEIDLVIPDLREVLE